VPGNIIDMMLAQNDVGADKLSRDQLISTLGLDRSFSILMLAVPSFWMGTMVMVFPSIWWGWSPQVNFVAFTVDPLQNLKQMILPAMILGTAISAITSRR
jgi:peptide/nickel transport system permease protein